MFGLFTIGSITSVQERITDSTVELDNELAKKDLVSVYKELTRNKSSKLKVVMIRPGNKRSCGKNRVGKYCADYNVYSKGSRGLKLESSDQKSFSKSDWNRITGIQGHLYLGGRPLAMKYDEKEHKVYLAKANIKLLTKNYRGFKINTKPAKQLPPMTYVIPAPVWDFFNGEGSCCPDCFATHRSMGLDCSVDVMCCFGACPSNDDCDDGGGGSGGGGGGDDGGDGAGDSSCSGEEEVEGAPVEIDGVECEFTGTVANVRDEDGRCMQVPVNGVFSCEGSGISVDLPDPAETQDATGGY